MEDFAFSYDYRFARILDMDRTKALALLGFGPHENPGPAELKKAQREKAIAAHPDRGGTVAEMQDINRAYDFLLAKPAAKLEGEPAHGGGARREDYSDFGWGDESWRGDPVKQEVSFEQAEGKAGIPGGVEWLFCTSRIRASHNNYSSDEFSSSNNAFVACGRVDADTFVFVAAKHVYYQAHMPGVFGNKDIWVIKAIRKDLKGKDAQNPSKLYGGVVDALEEVEFDGKFNSKVIDAKGWHFGEKKPTGAETSIKHWLVDSGLVAGDDASVAGRKHTVELGLGKSYEAKPGYYKSPLPYDSDNYQITLILNGKPFVLNEHDVTAFLKLKLGGKRIIEAVYGQYSYGGEKKNLLRLGQNKGYLVIDWLLEHAQGLPDNARAVLQAAKAQKKG